MNDSSYIPVDGGVCAPQGFLGSAVSCGIKKPTATRLDLALIYSTEPCVSAGTFTTNRVQAACVKVSREHLRKGNIRAIVANSGNANACTGTRGVEDARGECRSVAEDTLPEWQKCLKTVFPVRKPAIPVLREADSGNSFSSLFSLEFGAKNC